MECARAVMDRHSPYRMPLAAPLEDARSLSLLAVLPAEARRTARAAGLEPLIAELLAANQANAPFHEQGAARQELALRLIAFDAQVDALAFEVSCTRRQLDELIDTLDAREHRRQVRLAVSSLVVGAGTATVASAWSLARKEEDPLGPTLMAVAGGLTTTALGAASLLVPRRAARLEHRHNLLRPILAGADPEHLLPSFVFRMIAARFPGDAETPRDRMLVRFSSLMGQYVAPDDRSVSWEILANTGGIYPRPLLELRKVFFLLLEQAVAGVARDLELLDRSMVRLFATGR